MLLYGRIFLPTNVMEALMVRRFSPVSQLLVSSVSDSRIKNGGAVSSILFFSHPTFLCYFINNLGRLLLITREIMEVGVMNTCIQRMSLC